MVNEVVRCELYKEKKMCDDECEKKWQAAPAESVW